MTTITLTTEEIIEELNSNENSEKIYWQDADDDFYWYNCQDVAVEKEDMVMPNCINVATKLRSVSIEDLQKTSDHIENDTVKVFIAEMVAPIAENQFEFDDLFTDDDIVIDALRIILHSTIIDFIKENPHWLSKDLNRFFSVIEHKSFTYDENAESWVEVDEEKKQVAEKMQKEFQATQQYALSKLTEEEIKALGIDHLLVNEEA